jgi:rhodanese-related sulfurtransferase
VDVFPESKTHNVMNDIEFLQAISTGTKIIDVRDPERLDPTDILKIAQPIPIMYLASPRLETRYNLFTKDDSVVVVCDDYIDCFSAMLV